MPAFLGWQLGVWHGHPRVHVALTQEGHGLRGRGHPPLRGGRGLPYPASAGVLQGRQGAVGKVGLE